MTESPAPPATQPRSTSSPTAHVSARSVAAACAASGRFALAIIGPGALGLHFAARLEGVVPVALIARDAAAAARLRAGVEVDGRGFRPQAFGPEQAPEADWVIVLVKAGDTATAAATASRMRPLGVLSLQNGLTGELLRAHCAAPRVDQGITTEGAYRERGDRGDRVHPSGAGETLVPPGFEAVAELLVRAGLRARVAPDIAHARLAKLLVNAAINPLAALFRVPNGALLDPPHRVLLDTLVREALPVLRAQGLDLDEAAALARVHAVAHATATNRASMLQDMLAGRRTEIDAITGALLRIAADRAVDLPAHRAVHTLVCALEP
ncbi:MAG: 2-dehydropantoate 2-reductase [Rhodocyclaceae bacterium]|nr:MAG: 2-dehydropantoate 2-reductase [Rhodocyclaceae bacterium]